MNTDTLSSTIVLVVEDEPIQRMMAADLGRDAGFEPLEATDATQAIEILGGRADVRVVFTDMSMPRGPDGMTLAAMIRERWPPIELILTSDKGAPQMADLPARGVFFAKPYRRQDVIAAMQRFAA